MLQSNVSCIAGNTSLESRGGHAGWKNLSRGNCLVDEINRGLSPVRVCPVRDSFCDAL